MKHLHALDAQPNVTCQSEVRRSPVGRFRSRHRSSAARGSPPGRRGRTSRRCRRQRELADVVTGAEGGTSRCDDEAANVPIGLHLIKRRHQDGEVGCLKTVMVYGAPKRDCCNGPSTTMVGCRAVPVGIVGKIVSANSWRTVHRTFLRLTLDHEGYNLITRRQEARRDYLTADECLLPAHIDGIIQSGRVGSISDRPF